MNFDVLDANSFWAVPLVIAIVEVLKLTGLSKKYAPFASLLVGIGVSFLINSEMMVREMCLVGIFYALSASGLYSGVRTTSQHKDEIAQDLKGMNLSNLKEDTQPTSSGVSIKREEIVKTTEVIPKNDSTQ